MSKWDFKILEKDFLSSYNDYKNQRSLAISDTLWDRIDFISIKVAEIKGIKNFNIENYQELDFDGGVVNLASGCSELIDFPWFYIWTDDETWIRNCQYCWAEWLKFKSGKSENLK